jgi:hypothetical protein
MFDEIMRSETSSQLMEWSIYIPTIPWCRCENYNTRSRYGRHYFSYKPLVPSWISILHIFTAAGYQFKSHAKLRTGLIFTQIFLSRLTSIFPQNFSKKNE